MENNIIMSPVLHKCKWHDRYGLLKRTLKHQQLSSSSSSDATCTFYYAGTEWNFTGQAPTNIQWVARCCMMSLNEMDKARELCQMKMKKTGKEPQQYGMTFYGVICSFNLPSLSAQK